MYRFFTLALLFPLSVASAKPPAADWMGKTAVFTNADVVNARGASMGAQVFPAVPETLDPQTVTVTLVYKQGLTHVEVVCSSTGIYELQNGSEFGRRSALGNLHGQVLSSIVGKSAEGEPPKGAGVYGVFEAPPSAGEKMVSEFVKSREAEDLVVTLGWLTKEGPQVYATLYADRIDLNANAPKAAKK